MWALYFLWQFVLSTSIRQGNIYIIHQMMQHGADLRLIDLQGKTSLHHTVTGGNMWVEETAHYLVVFVFCLVYSNYTATHKYTVHALTVSFLSQCCSALYVGDRNVPLLRHRHVPGDTTSPGCIHRQHRGGPVSAQRPGMIQTSFSHSHAPVLKRQQNMPDGICLLLTLKVPKSFVLVLVAFSHFYLVDTLTVSNSVSLLSLTICGLCFSANKLSLCTAYYKIAKTEVSSYLAKDPKLLGYW